MTDERRLVCRKHAIFFLTCHACEFAYLAGNFERLFLGCTDADVASKYLLESFCRDLQDFHVDFGALQKL